MGAREKRRRRRPYRHGLALTAHAALSPPKCATDAPRRPSAGELCRPRRPPRGVALLVPPVPAGGTVVGVGDVLGGGAGVVLVGRDGGGRRRGAAGRAVVGERH